MLTLTNQKLFFKYWLTRQVKKPNMIRLKKKKNYL